MRKLLVLLALLAGSLIWAGTAGAGNGRVLILDSTVTSGASSLEAAQATADGKAVDIVNGAQWAAMTTAQFAAYDSIILGDPTCVANESPILPAIANASVWEPAVTGNVIIIGTDPVFHSYLPGPVRLIDNGVGFSYGDPSGTGLYLDLSCYYAFAVTNTPEPWMDGLSSFGNFQVRGQFTFGTSCPQNSHIVASAPVLSGLTDADLSNWSCSTHESFDQFPADFTVLVINEDISQTYTASDGTKGGPYILVRGREVHVISDITLTPASATNPIGTPHTVTATVMENGSPVVGTMVTFTVVAGPNTGTTGTGVTDVNGQATFTYTSALTGTDLIKASFTDSTGHTQSSDTVSKTWTEVVEQPITASGTTFSATEGAAFSGAVATFTDPDPVSTAAEYSATIDWGDSSSSAGVISGPVGGPFTVSGTHTYTEEGTYTVTVTITDVDTPSNTATATSTAKVADAALTATCAAPPVSPQSYSGPTAGLTDANSFGTVADFTATIDWGDSSSSSGTVSGPPGGPYAVSGSHSYASTGTFTITTTITDDGGSTATTSCKTVVFGTTAAGDFVIGNNNAAVGTAVTFWGSEWWKLNSLSGGAAPAAFKGFENTPATVTCGTSWSTGPGNSPPPPAGPLPAYMAVIVSSSIGQSGSTISGNTVHVVVVKTNPGYAPDPGHAGTGTVVAQVC
jgi:hypothetical protein